MKETTRQLTNEEINAQLNQTESGEVKASGKYDGILKYRNIKGRKPGYYLHNAQKVTNYSIEDEMDSMLMDRVKVYVVDKSHTSHNTDKCIFNKTGVLTKQQVNGHYHFFVNDIDLGRTFMNCLDKNIEVEIRSTKVCVSPDEDESLAMAFREDNTDMESEGLTYGAV